MMFACGVYQSWSGVFYCYKARHVHLTNSAIGFGESDKFGLEGLANRGNRKHYQIPEGSKMARWIPAFLYVGAAISPMPTAFFANRVQRKSIIIASVIPFYLSWIVLFLPFDSFKFVLSRLIGGIGIGVLYTICPLYLQDIVSSRNNKYRYDFHVKQAMFGLGMLYTNVVNSCFSTTFTYTLHFAVPVTGFLVFCVMPNSAHSLVLMGREKLAQLTVLEMRKHGNFDEALEEFREIRKKALNKMKELRKYNFFEANVNLLKHRAGRNILSISTCLTFFQQMTGFTLLIAVLGVFSESLMPRIDCRYLPICFSVTCTYISILSILFLNKVSRKLLMVVSNIGIFFSLGYITILASLQAKGIIIPKGYEWTIFAAFSMYGAMYSLGMGPLPDEFSAIVAPIEMSAEISGIQTQLLTVIILIVFLIDNAHNIAAMYIFLTFTISATVFVSVFVPETVNLTREELSSTLMKSKSIFSKDPSQRLGTILIKYIKKQSKQEKEKPVDSDEAKMKKEEFILREIAKPRHPSGRFIEKETTTQTKIRNFF